MKTLVEKFQEASRNIIKKNPELASLSQKALLETEEFEDEYDRISYEQLPLKEYSNAQD